MSLAYFDNRVVSQSALARLDVCPYSCMLYARHRDERVQSHAMARGELLHALAEWLIKECLRTGEVEIPPDVAREQVDALADERLDLVIPHRERDALRGMAWNLASGTTVNPANPPHVEVEVELEIGGWTVRGRIDRVDVIGRDVYIRDLKTSLATRSQEDFEASFQTLFYALLWSEGTVNGERIGEGADTFHLAEEYVRFVSKRCGACGSYNDGHADACKECGESDAFEPASLFRRTMTIGKRELHDFRRSLTTLLARLGQSVEDAHWPASPGSHCNTCPCQPECPLPRTQRPVQITTPEEARKYAQDLDRGEAELKRIKAALREWVKEEGEIRYGDRAWDFNTVITNSLDKEAMAAALQAEAGVDPRQFQKTSTSSRFQNKKVVAK